MPQLPGLCGFRPTDYPIELLFIDRWLPRSMSGATAEDSDLMRLFEAARWAPFDLQ